MNLRDKLPHILLFLKLHSVRALQADLGKLGNQRHLMVSPTFRPSDSRRSDTRNIVEYEEIVVDKELMIHQHDGGTFKHL